jgi:protein-arginine deiminase
MRAPTPLLIVLSLTAPPLLAQGVVDLDVDADRDGRVEVSSPEDDAGEEGWSSSKGAVMLFNCDDDDGDGRLDAADSFVNGGADALDLAPVVLGALPGLPAEWSGWLTIDPSAEDQIRIFRYAGYGSWVRFDPDRDNPLASTVLTQRILFGVEALDHAQAAAAQPGLWDGEALLTFELQDGDGVAQGRDSVRLRVAPFVLYSNLAPAERVLVTEKTYTQPFVAQLGTPVAAGGAVLEPIDGIVADPAYGIWVQDAMELGYSTLPTRLGPRSMGSVLRSPRGLALDAWTLDHGLGPDFGYVLEGSKRSNVGWIDWFGNLDCTPPLPGWPLGRIYAGYQGAITLHPEVLAFLDAQRVQGPVLQIDTGWLLIGHVDETVCFVPSQVGKPCRMLVPSTVQALRLLQGLASAGKGHLKVFEGKSSETTVSGLLGASTLVSYNQQLQARIDFTIQQMVTGLGLDPQDVIAVPSLFEPHGSTGRAVALMPNLVNSLVVGDRLIAADPFGPVDGGLDLFRLALLRAVTPLGLRVDFVDDWFPYHEWSGEVHCGTNAVRTPPATPWWSVP